MNRIGLRQIGIILIVIYAIAGIIVFNIDKEATEARKLYETIMLFVNFLILVFFFIKYAKNPLMNLLHGEQKKIAERIENLEDQLKDAKSLMEKEAANLEKMDDRLKEIKSNILEIGKRERENIIENAKITAKQMIDDAEKEAEFNIIAARDRFGHDMLDKAVSIAVDRLIKGISLEDNEKVVDKFASNLSTYQSSM